VPIPSASDDIMADTRATKPGRRAEAVQSFQLSRPQAMSRWRQASEIWHLPTHYISRLAIANVVLVEYFSSHILEI
jgi:hypothetical protein